MRRDDAHEHAPLVVGLPHEPHVAEAEVAQAAVDQLRRRARRRAGEVAPVDERDAHPVRARGLGDAGADDPPADDEQVEAARPELL